MLHRLTQSKRNRSGPFPGHLPFLSLLTAFVLTAGSAMAEEPAATMTITGESSISVAPDMAIVSAQVVTAHKTASDALSENTKGIERVINDLKTAGIEEKDIQTSGFSIYPRYSNRHTEPDRSPQITGYEVSNGVTVNIRKLDNLGSVLETIVSSGVNRMNGISFRVSNADDVLNEARKTAVIKAKAKADLYAEAAGIELGRILNLSETGGPSPRPYAMRSEKMMAMVEAAPVPIEAGEETLTARVTITWQIVP